MLGIYPLHFLLRKQNRAIYGNYLKNKKPIIKEYRFFYALMKNYYRPL